MHNICREEIAGQTFLRKFKSVVDAIFLIHLYARKREALMQAFNL
jgi:hypothetical protein